MTVDRKARKPLRAWILERSVAELAYVREEAAREEKRRRLAVRARRKAKAEARPLPG